MTRIVQSPLTEVTHLTVRLLVTTSRLDCISKNSQLSINLAPTHDVIEIQLGIALYATILMQKF